MRVLRSFSPTLFGILALMLALPTFSSAQNKENSFPHVKIRNFGQMDERFYRGARPKERDLKALAALGIRTIIDLTDNSKEYEQPAVEAAGLRYVNIPMKDKSYPSMEQVNQFLKVVDDPATGKFFVHCAGGRHRTGVMGAVYRFNHDQWTYDQVLNEMNQYEFGSGFGHGKQKDFVQNYWKEFQAKRSKSTNTATPGR